MPAGREGKRAEAFFFAIPPLNFNGARARRGAGFGGSLPSAAALLVYACQRVGRANGLNFFFALAPFNYPVPGGGVFGGSLQLAAAVLVETCQRDGRGSALNRFCL